MCPRSEWGHFHKRDEARRDSSVIFPLCCAPLNVASYMYTCMVGKRVQECSEGDVLSFLTHKGKSMTSIAIDVTTSHADKE